MDFIERLAERVNQIPQLPVTCRIGYYDTTESLAVYPLPGSRVIRTYFDGMKDQNLNYEFAMKSKSQMKIGETLWKIQNELEKLEELTSNDNSFEFDEIIITGKPFISEADEQGWFVFLLSIQAQITTLKEGD